MSNLTTKQLSFIEERLDVAISVPRKDQSPHTTAVWVIYHNEKFYFSTEKTRSKFKFINLNPNVTLSFIKHRAGYLTIEGTAKIRGKSELLDYDQIITKIVKKYVADDNQTQFKNNIVNNKSRVLIEIDPIKFYPNN